MGDGAQSSPAVANGMVYVGSDETKVYALTASAGTLLWSYTTGGGVYTSPSVANGLVYVGSDDGNVYAFRPGVKDGRCRQRAHQEQWHLMS